MTDTATSDAAMTRRYRVLYAVTRREYYEIDATDAKDAEDRAFMDGTFFDSGETTNVVSCEVEEIAS